MRSVRESVHIKDLPSRLVKAGQVVTALVLYSFRIFANFPADPTTTF